MSGAMLIVSRVSESELSFVLQLGQAQPAFMNARSIVDRELRGNISRAFEGIAESREGFHEDEPRIERLGQVLFGVVLPQPIRVQLRNLTSNEPLTILTDDPTLPWEILHDGEEFLTLKLSIARQLIFHERMGGFLRLPEIDKGEFSTLIIADPTDELPGAREEGEAVYGFLKDKGECYALFGIEATWENIQLHLVSRPYSIIHFCGHVDYDSDSRQSSIRLRDGRQLSADEVLPTFKGCPIVFLNACYSDINIEAKSASLRTESFAQAFMLGSENGVASAVIGTMWRVPDEPEEAGREFSLTFYRSLLEGTSVSDAMRMSRVMARDRKWGPMVWGPYVLYGNPSSKPFAERLASSGAAGTDATGRRFRESDGKQDGAEEQQGPMHPDDPADENKGKDGSLDTAARRIFNVALREMKQLNQSILSSMHLLIGLCDEEVNLEVLKRAFHEKGVDTVQLCKAARQLAVQLIPPQGEDLGISQSVARITDSAVRRARLFGKKISAEDLLAGLLEYDGSQAVRILASFKISRRELLKQLPQPQSSNWRFDRYMQEAMQHAVKSARNAHLFFLGTPHLLIGLVRTGSGLTTRLLRNHGVNLEKLCDTLQAGVGEGVSGNGNGGHESALPSTKRCNAILQRANTLAQSSASGDIAELHLLQAILEEKTGLTTRVLRDMGADPKELLIELLRPKDWSSG